MNRKVLLPLIVSLALANVVHRSAATTAQELKPAPKLVNSNQAETLNSQQLPTLSVQPNSQAEVVNQWNRDDLNHLADSIKHGRQQPHGKSVDPLGFFAPPSLPSSVKVPVRRLY